MAPIMIDDDSDDDIPLNARPRPTSTTKKPSRDSSSSEPERMKSFKSPVQKIVDDLSSEDDDDDDLAFHAAMTGRSPGAMFEMGSTPAKVVKSPPAGDGKDDDGDDDGDDDDVEVEDVTREDASEDDAEVSEGKKTAVDVPRLSANLENAPAPAPSTSKAPPPVGANTPDRIGELPLFVPNSLNRSKVFFECEGVGEAVDLEGDVGVVGRLLTESTSMQMDLKGVVYDARILQTPCSIVILAVNQTEAKVESVANDFVQLRMDPTSMNMHGATLDGYLGADSDDEGGALGVGTSAAIRAMDDSDDELGGKREAGDSGARAKKVQKLGADGKSSSRSAAKAKGKKKPKKRPKKK